MTSETFTSATGTYVKFDIYLPTILIRYKAVIQVHHATGAHSGNYKKFAEFLANNGYVVIVTDFPGHGTSLHDFEQGYFGTGDSSLTLVSDMKRLRDIIYKRYPELPYFILGDQFGSLVLRKFIAKYGEYIQGAIIMSTCGKVKALPLARGVIKVDEMIRGGSMHRSPTIKKYIMNRWSKAGDKKGDYYRTSLEGAKQEYDDDPYTDFTYTNSAIKTILQYIKETSSEEIIEKTPPYLPIYVISGKKDYLGHFGKGPRWLCKQYKKYHCSDVEMKIYNDSRSDLLHDVDRITVYHDVVSWLDKKVYG